MFARVLVFAALAFGAATRIHAQTSGDIRVGQPQRTARIRGVVFDSLIMLPIKNATVTLLSRMETVTTDYQGHFSFDDVPIGAQEVAFETPELDSLGLGTMGKSITLVENETARVTLSTPSLRTLWRRRCTNPLSADSGIVWGTIRDAATNKLLSNAIAAFNWFDMRSGPAPGLYLRDIRKEVLTDETGMFFACGVPTDVIITTAAIDTSVARGKGASGFIEYAVGSRGLQRLDFVISPDMIAPVNASLATHNDSVEIARGRGRATLKGTVVDDKKKPVANATVAITGADTSVVTNDKGVFVVTGLPAGTHSIQTRRIGYAPINQLVALRSDSVTEVQIIAAAVFVVSVYNVRAEKTKSVERIAYELRRKMGFGQFAEEKDMARRIDMYGVLSQFSGLRVTRENFDLRVLTRSSGGKMCSPPIFIDGMFAKWEAVEMMLPKDFKAIEVYTRTGTAPMQYAGTSECGVILFWTKGSLW